MSTTIIATQTQAPAAARWIAASSAGWAAGFVLSILFLVAVESVDVRHTQFPLALGMGLGVGFAQARLLAGVVAGRRRWISATALGLAAPFIVTDLAGVGGLALPYSLVAHVSVGGIVVGVLQARTLAGVGRQAAWWIPGSAAAWMLAGSTVSMADRFQPPGVTGLLAALLYVSIIVLGGVMLGAVGAVVHHRITDPVS